MLNNRVLNFFANLFWLNIRRFRKMWFWRLLFVLVTFGTLFVLTEIDVSWKWWSVMVLFCCTEMAVINLKAYVEARSTISLLRSLGASRVFVVMNMFFEMILPYLSGVVVAFVVRVFTRIKENILVSTDWGRFWVATLVGFSVILVMVPFFTLFLVYKQERYLKEL